MSPCATTGRATWCTRSIWSEDRCHAAACSDPRRPLVPAAARRADPAHPGLRARVDRPQRERPRDHADRAVRLPRREPALPLQPDPGCDQARVPAPFAAAAAPGDRGARAGHDRAHRYRHRVGAGACGHAAERRQPRVLQPDRSLGLAARSHRDRQDRHPGAADPGRAGVHRRGDRRQGRHQERRGGRVLPEPDRPRRPDRARRGAGRLRDRGRAGRLRQVGRRRDLGRGAPDSGSELVWQASTGVVDAQGEPQYLALATEGDTTRALAQQGTVQLRLPANILALGVYPITDPDLQGTGNFPPQIEDATLAADVLFWLRASRRDPARPLAKVIFIGINATEVLQSVKAQPEFLGTGNAQPDQTFTLIHKPAISGSERIQVEEVGGWTDWQSVDGFEASSEDSRHYVLDPEAGTLKFGNGVRGRAPQLGERIRAVQYHWGGGAAGNVGAKAIGKVAGFGQLEASNPLPATGGAEGEAIADAIERVPGELRRHDRAVTAGDFQELALHTPGAVVGRAECMPLFDPKTKSQEAAGVVSVVVWPAHDLKHPNTPVPDRALLNQVCAWLDARRLVTTELYVIPPTYRAIAVAVGVQAKPGYGIEAVRRWVELVIRQYLAPLPPYGPDGQGWALGRSVYGPELEAAALQVEGVLLIECLRRAERDPGGRWVEAGTDAVSVTPGCLPRERVTLQPWEVPELAEITVVQGDALTPGEAVGTAISLLVAIPIPTVAG